MVDSPASTPTQPIGLRPILLSFVVCSLVIYPVVLVAVDVIVNSVIALSVGGTPIDLIAFVIPLSLVVVLQLPLALASAALNGLLLQLLWVLVRRVPRRIIAALLMGLGSAVIAAIYWLNAPMPWVDEGAGWRYTGLILTVLLFALLAALRWRDRAGHKGSEV